MFSLIKVLAFINKVIQIHETQSVRHGMMVIREAGSARSTSILILATALTKLLNKALWTEMDFIERVE
jgi:hypothetical protein